MHFQKTEVLYHTSTVRMRCAILQSAEYRYHSLYSLHSRLTEINDLIKLTDRVNPPFFYSTRGHSVIVTRVTGSFFLGDWSCGMREGSGIEISYRTRYEGSWKADMVRYFNCRNSLVLPDHQGASKPTESSVGRTF